MHSKCLMSIGPMHGWTALAECMHGGRCEASKLPQGQKVSTGGLRTLPVYHSLPYVGTGREKG